MFNQLQNLNLSPAQIQEVLSSTDINQDLNTIHASVQPTIDINTGIPLSTNAASEGSKKESTAVDPDLYPEMSSRTTRGISSRAGPANSGANASSTNNQTSSIQSDELAPIPRRIREIVLGDALPANENEAFEAAEERRNCEIRKIETMDGEISSARVRANMAAPPEFAPQNRKAESVHCICGNEGDDTRGEWIACDSCGVWQHNNCMGEGVPANPEQDDYDCQQCDPFRHRKLIRTMRKTNSLPESCVPSEQT